MEKKKQLTFDIDTNIAKEILGEKNYTDIYKKIRKFMEGEGWVHIEGSVYMSQKPLSNMQIAHLVYNLNKKYPYITKCVREMHQADISEIHSLNHYFEYDGTPGKYVQIGERSKEDVRIEKNRKESLQSQKVISVSERIKQKQAAVAKREGGREIGRQNRKHLGISKPEGTER